MRVSLEENMSYKIIVDSCGELTEEMKQSGKFETVPLSIELDDRHIIDDESFDQKEFLKQISESAGYPKSSCPSPERFKEAYHCEQERIYVVTLSAELSGTYNSAMLGHDLYVEEHGEKDIYVFNSRSASVGETLIALKIMQCEQENMSFKEVIDTVEAYIAEQNTYFVLETIEILKKSGRLTGAKALVATALNIKPILGSTVNGTIAQLGKARGINKALPKMIDQLVKEAKHTENKILAIAHCNCLERAKMVKNIIESQIKIKDVIILNTRGISTMYANQGGIIVVV